MSAKSFFQLHFRESGAPPIFADACVWVLLTSTMKDSINLGFVQKLRVFGLDRFEFDGHFFTGGHVGTQINVPKRTATDFTAQTVLFSNPELHCSSCSSCCYSLSNSKRNPQNCASKKKGCELLEGHSLSNLSTDTEREECLAVSPVQASRENLFSESYGANVESGTFSIHAIYFVLNRCTCAYLKPAYG